MRQFLRSLVLLLALASFSSAFARFELVKEWTSDTGGLYQHVIATWVFPDGSRYFHDLSPGAEYPVWRLLGHELVPITGISHEQIAGGYAIFYPVQDWVLMIARNGSQVAHWRIEGQDAIPLEPVWGPIPTTKTSLLVTMDEGIIFTGDHPEYGREMWLMDKSGYHLLGDVNPGPANGYEPSLYSNYQGGTGEYLLFELNDGVHGKEPWVYHKGAGLTLVADIEAGLAHSYPRRIGTRGNEVYFGAVPNRIFKFDGESMSLVQQGGNIRTSPRSNAQFRYQGELFAWWEYYEPDPGFMLRISADDEVQGLSLKWTYWADPINLHSAAPWNGAIELQGAGRNQTLRVTPEGTVKSDLFKPWAQAPIVRKFSENELLFQETRYGDTNRDHVFCLTQEAGRTMWKGEVDGYGAAHISSGGDWIYLNFANNAAELGEPGGVMQVWAMKWPEGCQDAWKEELIYSSSFE